MRYDVCIDVTEGGAVELIGWRAKDDHGETLALGCQTVSERDQFRDWEDLLALALDLCTENIERNSGQRLFDVY